MNVNILLVEDNRADQRVTQEAFKRGHVQNNLVIVNDGLEALDYLYQRGQFAGAPRPDLILLDLNMPRLDGRAVLEKIKNDSVLKRIPVIILTTSDTEIDILQSYDLHANAYITKPVDVQQLVNVVKVLDDFWISIVKLPPPTA